jgi:hypothetical protein
MSPEFPLARSEGLITEELDGELLVYDSESNMAHALGAETSAVWRACDGRTDGRGLAGRCDASEEKVRDAVARLGELGLLEGMQDDRDGDTRRAALRKITIAGVGVASASTISSILVPNAAAQGSCVQPGNCIVPGQTCCSGHPIANGTCAPFSVPGQLCCVVAGACATPVRDMEPSAVSCCNGTGTPDSTCQLTGIRCT